MSEYEIKVRAAILTMKTKLKKLEISASNEPCSSIRYECRIHNLGYMAAIADLMKLID